MVKSSSALMVSFGYTTCIVVLFYIKSALADDKRMAKRNTDSFVVSANYGVESTEKGNSNYSQELLPTPSSWRASFYPLSAYEPGRSSSQIAAATSDVIYGVSQPINNSINTTTRDASSMDRTDQETAASSGYEVNELLSDIHRPSVADLQEIIRKIIKGATKVHQVVKVPAVYEIHLQEEEKPKDSWKSLHVPLPTGSRHIWKPQHSFHSNSKSRPWRPHYSHQFVRQVNKRKPNYHSFRGSKQATKTWNLPSKLKYFERESTTPIYGKYSYPKPFTVDDAVNTIPLDSWSSYPQLPYGSVSVPMTPGSTAVSFIDYHGGTNYHQDIGGGVDLSLYYAKKKELESDGLGLGQGQPINNSNRRSAKANSRGWHRSQPKGYSPFDGVNYIIHVTEKKNRN